MPHWKMPPRRCCGCLYIRKGHSVRMMLFMEKNSRPPECSGGRFLLLFGILYVLACSCLNVEMRIFRFSIAQDLKETSGVNAK